MTPERIGELKDVLIDEALALSRGLGYHRRSERGMTEEEILKLLYDETLVGNAPAVADGVNEGLSDGIEPETMLYDALIPSLEEVGARFERGDYFVPEMLIAARAMQGALDILRPLLAESGNTGVGTFLMGTVKGDVHDIGKNLCNIMLEGAGFTVIDLGVNVPPEKFIEQIERARARHRRLLGVPDDDDADVQGEHQRAREGRPARQGDRDGRRGACDPGVRRRGRRRRLLGRRVLGGQEGQAADRAQALAGAGVRGERCAFAGEFGLAAANASRSLASSAWRRRMLRIRLRVRPGGRTRLMANANSDQWRCRRESV